jgi:hypothetical protein
VLTEDKLDEIGDWLEYSRGKFLIRLAKETGGFKNASTDCHKTPGNEAI